MKIAVVVFSVFIMSMSLTACVKTSGSWGNNGMAPAGTKFLTADELKALYTGKTTAWTSRGGKSGLSTYNADGTYSRGTWKVTDNGYKCNYQASKDRETCTRIYKEGGYYYGVNKKGKIIFQFTIKQ